MNGKKALPLIVIASMLLSLTSVMFTYAVLAPPHLTAVTGTFGTVIKVTGDPLVVPAGTTVQLYWDDSTIAWNGVKGLLNSTNAKADGNYEVWFKVPEATNGAHYLWVKTTTGGIADVASALFTVAPLVKVSPSSGLPGDIVTVTGYGYRASAVVGVDWNVTTLTTATANSLGTVTTTVTVPAKAVNPNTVKLHDDTAPAVIASVAFNVGPVITITPTTGTVGSVVSITGRGFTPSTALTGNEVTLGTTVCKIITTSPTTDALGRLRIDVVIPDAAKGVATMTVNVAPAAATADFEVTAVSSVSVAPTYGPVASSIVITGVNFPKVSGVTVAITLNAVSIGSATTAADGTFSGTFTVPAATEGTYPVVATATGYNIAPTVNFKVGTMNILLSSTSGATGKTVTLSGNGFTAGGTWNATLGSKTIIATAPVVAGGLLSGGTFQVPQLPVGTYDVVVFDKTSGISLKTTFQITQTTEVTLSVPSAPNGFNVTMKGKGFSAASLGAVIVQIYNTTSAGVTDFYWTLTVVNLPSGVGAASTNSSGQFYGSWIVDPSNILAQGNYNINVTDASGKYKVTVPFAVSAAHVVAESRKPVFKVGDTISFNLEHSFTASVMGSVLKIYDPNGTLTFSGDPLNTWVQTGLWYSAPYSSQTAGGNPMVLDTDAPIGTWSWTWTKGTTTIKTGTFSVAASDASQLEQQVTQLGTQVTALTTQLTQLATTVGNVATTATAASNAATAASTAASAAATAAQSASTTAGQAATAAQAALTAAQSAKTSADNAASAASGLTTLVYAAIGASLVAALAAIVALMQISRKIA